MSTSAPAADADRPRPPGDPVPLAGLTVVELAGIGPAPLACRLLHDLGAEVTRVHRPGWSPDVDDGLGGGRPTLGADLATPEGRSAVLGLVATADVLVEGFRPGVAERLGVGPRQCRARNPRLVYARMTGWGQEGPLASSAGHDINYLSLTGALHTIGEAGGPPLPPLNLVADFGGGSMFLVVGILAALHARASTGTGQVVDAAMVDGAAYLMTMTYRLFGAGRWTDERGANLLDGGAPFYRTYRCRDGRYVAVGALEPAFFSELVRVLDLPDAPAQGDRARWPQLAALLAGRFATRDRDDWADRFAGTDACVSPVLSLAEAPHHPYNRARSVFREDDGGPVPGPAPRFRQADR